MGTLTDIFEVIFRLCFRTGCEASTEPGGKDLPSDGGRLGGRLQVTWDVGTVGRTFCIFSMEGRKGDLLGDMRLSRERWKEAGLGALEMWFGSEGGGLVGRLRRDADEASMEADEDTRLTLADGKATGSRGLSSGSGTIMSSCKCSCRGKAGLRGGRPGLACSGRDKAYHCGSPTCLLRPSLEDDRCIGPPIIWGGMACGCICPGPCILSRVVGVWILSLQGPSVRAGSRSSRTGCTSPCCWLPYCMLYMSPSWRLAEARTCHPYGACSSENSETDHTNVLLQV